MGVHTRTHTHLFSQSKAKEEEGVLAVEKESVDAGMEEQVALEGRLVDLRHEQDRYTAKVKENQQKVKHFNNQVKGRGSMSDTLLYCCRQ